DDGVAGVGPAVVADHELVPVPEQIDELPLGLVAPLQADDTGARHERGFSQVPPRGPKAAGVNRLRSHQARAGPRAPSRATAGGQRGWPRAGRSGIFAAETACSPLSR